MKAGINLAVNVSKDHNLFINANRAFVVVFVKKGIEQWNGNDENYLTHVDESRNLLTISYVFNHILPAAYVRLL